MPERFTLSRLLTELAETRSDSPAVTLSETITFGDLLARSSRVAGALRARGVRAGDRVALLDKNAPSFYEVLFGATGIGASVVGLNFRLAATELADIVHDAEPALIVCAPEFRALLPPDVPVIELGAEFDAWRDSATPIDIAAAADPQDVALQLYSSGTTGRPKAALLSHANLAWTPVMGRDFYAMDAQTVNLVPSPLFHIGGVGYSLTAMGQGAHTVLVRDVDPGRLLGLIDRHRVTHSFMVPAVIGMLLEHPDLRSTDLSSLQRIAYGAAPMSSDLLLRAIAAFGCEFMAVYGMTETAGSVVSLPPADHDPGGPRAGLLRSIGRPLPWLSVRVVDPVEFTDSPAGTVGEIWVQSPQNMLGYWRNPALTSSTIVQDGWLRTGDAASRDTDGYLYMHDRIKDMIVSGGENIYPAEVENVLSAHPDVLDLAVIGVPSERWGETVKALVIRRPGSTTEPAALISWTRERLAHYKCPTSVEFVEMLPRNASGKLLKQQLRAPFWADRVDAT